MTYVTSGCGHNHVCDQRVRNVRSHVDSQGRFKPTREWARAWQRGRVCRRAGRRSRFDLTMRSHVVGQTRGFDYKAPTLQHQNDMHPPDPRSLAPGPSARPPEVTKTDAGMNPRPELGASQKLGPPARDIWGQLKASLGPPRPHAIFGALSGTACPRRWLLGLPIDRQCPRVSPN